MEDDRFAFAALGMGTDLGTIRDQSLKKQLIVKSAVQKIRQCTASAVP
jgi:hypothetical protein